MEITDASVVLTNPGRNYVLVKLETEDGLVGWGDATLNGREQAVCAALCSHIFPEITGSNAREIEDTWQHLFRHTYWRGGPVLNSALSGVDMALWDLAGKRLGVPVYELLGGKTRDYATVYVHCGGDTVETTIENCRDALERGIDHWRVNIASEGSAYVDIDRIVEAVGDIRERVGPSPELIVDIHGGSDPIQAAHLARQFEPLELYFLEDPIRPENQDSFERIRSLSTTPLAMGEVYANTWEIRPLIEANLIDFIRVDLAHIGGITAAKKLATLGEFHYVKTAFHGPPDLSPVGQAATVHLDVSIPNFGIQEFTDYNDLYGEAIDAVFTQRPTLDEDVGGLTVPSAPGLGVAIDESAATKYEYERAHLPAPRWPDNSVRDW